MVRIDALADFIPVAAIVIHIFFLILKHRGKKWLNNKIMNIHATGLIKRFKMKTKVRTKLVHAIYFFICPGQWDYPAICVILKKKHYLRTLRKNFHLIAQRNPTRNRRKVKKTLHNPLCST